MTKRGILPLRITFLWDILYREANVACSQWNGKKYNICKEGMYTGQLNSIFYPGIITCTYMRTPNFGSNAPNCFNPINPIFPVAQWAGKGTNEPTKPWEQNPFALGRAAVCSAISMQLMQGNCAALRCCGMTDGFPIKHQLLGARAKAAKSWRAAPHLHGNKFISLLKPL